MSYLAKVNPEKSRFIPSHVPMWNHWGTEGTALYKFGSSDCSTGWQVWRPKKKAAAGWAVWDTSRWVALTQWRYLGYCSLRIGHHHVQSGSIRKVYLVTWMLVLFLYTDQPFSRSFVVCTRVGEVAFEQNAFCVLWFLCRRDLVFVGIFLGSWLFRILYALLLNHFVSR